MTELERFAAALLAASEAEGARPEAAIAVGSLTDRIFTYATARRVLGIDTAESYETLLLQLVAEVESITIATPLEAAEMARGALDLRVPDLDVLRRLRSATIAFTDEALSRLEGVRIVPRQPGPAAAKSQRDDSGVIPLRPRREVADATAVATALPVGDGGNCWSCGNALPVGRAVKFCVECGADQRTPHCAACGGEVEPNWRHCPECGGELESR